MGFLGDKKYDENGNEVSTPDGNAFYSWSIIRAFQQAGFSVYSLMKDRDRKGFTKDNFNLFDSWCKEQRAQAYIYLNSNDILRTKNVKVV